jgi:hypothetical protein
VKHAGPDALAALEPLLRELRALDAIKERAAGTFYRKSKAFLHFHEDSEGLFADVRITAGADFERLRVSTAQERKRFIALVRLSLK